MTSGCATAGAQSNPARERKPSLRLCPVFAGAVSRVAIMAKTRWERPIALRVASTRGAQKTPGAT